MRTEQIALFNDVGARKYLCASEIPRFLGATVTEDADTRAFCWLLVCTGCRLSEAISLTPAQLDADARRVILRTLKRRKIVYRAVPVPETVMRQLLALASDLSAEERIWRWCRQTAWRRVKAVMRSASIEGAHAMPKGLRHAFGVANAEKNVPMATTQKWLGHAKLETTAIYQQAVGHEETAFAERLWRSWNIDQEH